MPALRPSIIWSAAVTRKPVIFCVDDALSVLEDREMLLEENGYQVLTAANAKEAVQAFMSNPVDLVLLDHMPQMDGGGRSQCTWGLASRMFPLRFYL